MGSVESATRQAVERAIQQGQLDAALDAPLCEMASALAGELDRSVEEGYPMGSAKVAAELRKVLVRLRLAPEFRVDSDDEFDQFKKAVTGSSVVGDDGTPDRSKSLLV